MEQYGILIGSLLLALVTACAVLLARRAAIGVEQFREEQHERFTGRKS